MGLPLNSFERCAIAFTIFGFRRFAGIFPAEIIRMVREPEWCREEHIVRIADTRDFHKIHNSGNV